METAPLKSFATWARTALIREVAARIAVVLAPASPERVEQPSAVAALEKAVSAAGGGDAGRAAVADKVAYTWFNRIIALRFMDANGYTGIGVVSPERGREGGQPEVLAEAKRGNIDSTVVTNKRTVETVTSLLNGTRRSDDPQGEAYALLLAEYCRYWNRSMPFMFEREGDYTELLIPANLLADDSVLARAVAVLTEEVCQDVEVIGWLYQFYISERKDEVFAGFKKDKKAGAAEIPAATQLFTPHWIVRYLVENSLGRLWLLNRPTSRLADQMDYYIAPVDEETDYLKVTSPEELKIIDPACGSGHMLTYAFDLLYAIYEEEGYAPSDIPGLILANNLYGTEIDPRAGALAAFALTMKARARQRTFFNKQVEPNICVLEPISFTPSELDTLVTRSGDRADEEAFWNQFQYADTFGSLIHPREELIDPLTQHLDAHVPEEGDLLANDLVSRARRVLIQAEYLLQRYSVVVANPPYMSSRNMDASLGDFVGRYFPDSKLDLFAVFIERSWQLVRSYGYVALITMHSWMFLGSYEHLRRKLTSDGLITSMAHLGTGAFDSIPGEVVSTTAFVLARESAARKGVFVRLVNEQPSAAKQLKLLQAIDEPEHRFIASALLFGRIPESPIAYWVTETEAQLYAAGRLLSTVGTARKGIDTGENARFVRFWFEVSYSDLRTNPASTEKRWVPYNKGGPNLRWYGNRYWVVDWADDGREIRQQTTAATRKATIRNPEYFFREGLTYTAVSPGRFSARYTPANAIFDNGGGTYFADNNLLAYGALLNSSIAQRYFEFLAPTLNFQPGDISRVPIAPGVEDLNFQTVRAIEIARGQWDANELSWDFSRSPFVFPSDGLTIRDCLDIAANQDSAQRAEISMIERQHDLLLAPLYGIPNHDFEIVSDGSASDAMDVGEAVGRLVSYAVGCMLGRYSLDEPGLILANQGDTLRHYLTKVANPTFMPDEDNVIPVVDGDWFEDDIVARFRQFLRVAFGEEHFEKNLRFVTESLGVKDLRDYFVKSFYRDHVQRYKKRPIYWLFSSPKGSFNALIYMHRYTPSTVSIVLNEYLRAFKAKLDASRQQYERLAAGTGTPRQQAVAHKEIDRLRKVMLELDEYEHDVLYPLAAQQVQIDLDDGVKANYPKFGAAVKKITGLEASDG